ncbi:MAG: AAA family ATPase [Pyrinomonadaceae bacterium]|nr:AAA family ATPase [Pyrinomonadaceae bacterium]
MPHAATELFSEAKTMGEPLTDFKPPAPESLQETDVSESFLCDLALKHVSILSEPTTALIAERMHLPRTLAEELLQRLYREKLIEVRLQAAMGATRYAMLERGWERVKNSLNACGYTGAAPVSLADYNHMMRLQAVPTTRASMETMRAAMRDLVLPDSLLETLGCVVNSRRSLFLTGPPGTGKTSIAERVNNALDGVIWIPYAIEVDNQIIRVYDAHNHNIVSEVNAAGEHDTRWVAIRRPLIVVGGELTLDDTDLQWSETAKFYEAPFQMKSNGGTLVIDDFGRQRVAPHELLNRWIVPLERRVDYLTLATGKKLEVPFEQLIIFATNLDEKDLVDEAFLRRMGYRARVEPPTPSVYVEIFKRAAYVRGMNASRESLDHILNNYMIEQRQMKACEPRDLLERITDICLFENRDLEIIPKIVDKAWRNYFGAAHNFTPKEQSRIATEQTHVDPLQL